VVKKAVVILADFSDNVGSTPPAHYDSLIFSVNEYPTGSVKDFYIENSYGILDLQGEVTPVWVRLPNPYSYYTNGNYGFGSWPQNAQGMARDAVLAADSLIDFSQYDLDGDGYVDAVIIIHAGPGAEATGDVNDIWSHAWYIPYPPTVDGVQVYSYTTDPENGGCGVIAHEFGHRPLGLPDLYDTDYSSEGLGNWSLMAAGSWNMNQTKPAHLDAWCKYRLGFVTVDTVVSNLEKVLIPAVEDTGLVFRLWTNGNTGNEYYLVENRQKKKFDVGLPGEGILIYHVDDNQSNNNNEWYPGHTSYGHYRVALEQADGAWDLERNANRGDAGDPFPGTTTNRHFDLYSIPDSRDYDSLITYVGVKNISDSQDTMYADLLVNPYSNVRVEKIIASRVVNSGDTVESQGIVFNDGYNDMTISFHFSIRHEDSSLIKDTTGSVFLSAGSRDTLIFPPFTAQGEDEDFRLILEITDSPGSILRDNAGESRVYSFIVKKDIYIPYLDTTASAPVIDGIVDSSEYALSYQFDVSDVFDNSSGGGVDYIIRGAKAYALIVHDTLFIGFVLPVDSTQDNLDRIFIDIDDNGDGSYPDTLGNEGEYYFYDGSIDLIKYRPLSNTTSGIYSNVDIPFVYSVIDNEKHVEIAIPLTTAVFPVEAINMTSVPGNFKMSIRILDGTRGIGWWPQDMLPSSIFDPLSYATVHVVPSGIEENYPGDRAFYLSIKKLNRGESLVFKAFVNQEVHYEIHLYNVEGRKVLARKGMLNKGYNSVSLNVKHLPAGLYFVKMQISEKEVLQDKIVILD